MSHEKKAVAKHLFDQGETIAAIARQLDVSRRTIERWADEGAWREKRGVIPIGEAKKKPLQPPPASTHTNPPAIRPHRRGGEALNELEIIETAIFDVAAAMTTASSEDVRSLGGLASGLVRLMEYRRKVQPPTAAALAEQVIEMGISPADFTRELREKWQLRA